MKFIVVDGLRERRLVYKELIEKCSKHAEIFQCMSAEDALFTVVDKNPDLIITSEILPFRSGFELARILNQMKIKNPVIIIADDSSNALQAIKLNVFEYLLMPLTIEKMNEVIQNATSYIDQNLHLQLVKNYDENVRIRLNTFTGYKLIKLDELAFCVADGSYTRIGFSNGKTDLSSYYLGKIENILAEYQFIRISRSAIVNLKKVNKIDRTKKLCFIEMENGLREFKISKANLNKLEMKNFF